ncbi:MAG TPA: hypothetical protein VIZ60_02825 [Rubrobacter sp.]
MKHSVANANSSGGLTSLPIPTATSTIKTSKYAGNTREIRWVRRTNCGLRSGWTSLRPELMYHHSAAMTSPVRSKLAK